MGHYELNELKELELLCNEYAKKFDLDIKELELEFNKHMKIGEEILKNNKGIFQKIHEYLTRDKNPIGFREICLSTVIWGNQFHVENGDDRIDKFLTKFLHRNYKGYMKVLEYASGFQYLSRALQELHNMARAHLFLSSTPKSMLLENKKYY